MLQIIHERIKGWIAGIIIAVISASFVLWGIQYYLQAGQNGSNPVATVNGEKISQNELQATTQQLQRQYTAETRLAPTDTQNQQMQQYALQQLILNSVLLQSAKSAGFRVSTNQINQLILNLPQFQVNGQFSPQQYQQLLYANGLTSQQFLYQTSNAILLEQVQSGIENSAFVLSDEIKTAYNLLYQQRSFKYVVVPSSNFFHSINITPAQIQQYYQKNTAQFRIPAKVSIEYIVLSPQEISKTITVTPAQIKQYYENNINNYRVPRRWKIERIFLPVSTTATPQQINMAQEKAQAVEQQLKKGMSFATLMKKEEGMTQWVNEVDITSQFASYLSTMKPGQVSSPVKTNEGINIVRLIAFEPAKIKPLSTVEDEVKKRFIQQKANTVFSQQTNQLSEMTYTNPTTLEPAAKALKLNIQATNLFSQQGEKTGMASNSNVVATAFSEDVLQNGNNSNPITLKDGSVLVLRVKQHVPSRIPSLNEVIAPIKVNMTQQLAQIQSAIMAEKIQSAVDHDKNVDNLLSKNQLKWKMAIRVLRSDKHISPNILSAGFQLNLQKDHTTTTVVLPNGNSAVVQLQAIQWPNFNTLSSAAQKELMQKMADYFGQLDYQFYIQSTKKNATIKIK